MSTKMKGLLKGLRYISQIFDSEKEQDMEIGYPTDVKHVAHIGWDGPSSSANELKSEGGSTENNASKVEDGQAPRLPDIPRSSKRQSSGGGGGGVTTSEQQSDAQRRSRRHHSSSLTSSLPREGATGKSKPRQAREGSVPGSESVSSTSDAAPKKNRQKKSRDSSSKDGGESSRRATSQTFNDPGSEAGPRFQSHEISAGIGGNGEEEKKYNDV